MVCKIVDKNQIPLQENILYLGTRLNRIFYIKFSKNLITVIRLENDEGLTFDKNHITEKLYLVRLKFE